MRFLGKYDVRVKLFQYYDPQNCRFLVILACPHP